jgi:hypothetical protein
MTNTAMNNPKVYVQDHDTCNSPGCEHTHAHAHAHGGTPPTEGRRAYDKVTDVPSVDLAATFASAGGPVYCAKPKHILDNLMRIEGARGQTGSDSDVMCVVMSVEVYQWFLASTGVRRIFTPGVARQVHAGLMGMFGRNTILLCDGVLTDRLTQPFAMYVGQPVFVQVPVPEPADSDKDAAASASASDSEGTTNADA